MKYKLCSLLALTFFLLVIAPTHLKSQGRTKGTISSSPWGQCCDCSYGSDCICWVLK